METYKDCSLTEFKHRLNILSDHKNTVVQRILAELEFAQGLARLETRGGWRKLIAKACEMIEEAAGSASVNKLNKAVKSAEGVLAPIGKVAKRYSIHCVGHAHIDMNWMWSWPETVAATNDTFTTVLKLMEEFPDFRFTQSQASVYEIVRQYNPEMFEQIRTRVSEGRWEIAAVHWVEGDKNLASGESLARHLLYTRRYMKEHFDLCPEDVPLDWEPDTFGHAVTIPTIISRGGVSRYYLWRGGDFPKPPVFWWQGPDGSKVLVNREIAVYGNHIGPHAIEGLLSFCRRTNLKDWMLVYGVGDHGGGPTRRDLRLIREMNSWPIYPCFKFATTKEYYDILEKHGDRLPVLDCELNFEFTGCYSSQSRIKQLNRLGENNCIEAETFAALAYRAVGKTYPGEQLRQAWIDTIFGHFHDILPGSGIRATREYQSGLFQKSAAITGMIRTQSLRGIAFAVDTSFSGEPASTSSPQTESIAMGAGVGRGATFGGLSTAGYVTHGPRPFVIFNPTAWRRSEVVKTTVWDTGDDDRLNRRVFIVRTPDGQSIAAQRIDHGDYWGHKFVELAFPATVDAMGYKTYIVEDVGVDKPDPWYNYQKPVPKDAGVKIHTGFRNTELQPAGNPTMENGFIFVEFDKSSGGIVKLLDKSAGQDLAHAGDPLGVLEYVLEQPRSMSSWLIGDVKSRICPLELQSFRPRLTGPHVASMVAEAKINDSTATVTYALKADQPWLEIGVSVNWLERGGAEIGTPTLRMRFPLALTGAKGRYEIPFGSIERDLASGEEVPALRWADVNGKLRGSNVRAGCALLNDCKYGHSLDRSTLRLTLIRSSYEPDPLPELGGHTTRIALLPHGKSLVPADLIRLGAAFNHPLQVASTDVHRGKLPATGGPVATSQPANVVISAIKKAEDVDAVIFRLFETAGKATSARVKLDRALMGKVIEAVELDFIERPLENSTAKVRSNGFSVDLPAHGIASVMVGFT